MEEYWWYIITGGVVVIALIMLLGVMMERRRNAGIALAAEDLSLRYQRDGRHLFGERFTRFGLFREGRSKRIKNVMQGHYEDIEVLLFDYRFTVGSHRHAANHHQTVAAYHLIGQNLAEFSLRPENVLHKIGELFGYQDIDFDDHPRFSAQYLLRGPNEDAIGALFTPELRIFFRDRPGWCVEGGGEWLIVFHRDKRVGPDDLADFLKQSFEVCAMFGIK